MLRKTWSHRWGIAIIAQMAGAFAAGYLTGPLSPAQTWLYRAVVGEAVTGTLAFIAVYTRLGGWRSHIGQTILVKSALLLAALTPAFLSLYFTFTRLDSRVAAGVDASALASIGLVMVWRIGVWFHESARPGNGIPPSVAERLSALERENERLAAENERLRARIAPEEKL